MKIKVLPSENEFDGDGNKSLLENLQAHGYRIRTVCNGKAQCAECRVKLVAGEDFCSRPTKAELSQIGSSHYLDGRRLSCQVRFYGPIVVDISEQLQRSDTSGSKKIRGLRSTTQSRPTFNESHAKQGTLLLDEGNPESSDKRGPRRGR